jgi:hypothetical protein
MTRLAASALALGLSSLLVVPAHGAPSVPAPTVKVVWDMSDAQPVPQQEAPAYQAAWTVAKAGHDGTLTASGPMVAWNVDMDAVWTSDLLAAPRRGATIARVAMTWSSVTLNPNPLSPSGSPRAILVRYGDAAGKWGEWITIAKKNLCTFAADGVGEQKADVAVRYNGAASTSKVRVQVRIADVGAACYLQNATAHITA